ncbi:MAG: hypothetical protein A3D96_05155 [Chlamydiae bacterium RIFCSPHIGHO2_12_FULL_44_59]|nr:MAG: hypothetical protein A2796_03180 [Chlamydiae bacterium RIFCSPHIGHO2_01_FULL_44_39]OGN57657.1 MAG: hypothetical protein A3C42_06545 [Chlamydiae bacterium RIFCSPHIGHO2_02_FULL_45_9]OGN60204.1 MAG: hypothetical protein A3D96_05155 [Chlamydiae bacterium RIFCSPHIGHO2_12_FULL_44_59]OGN67142.1 MAG: hypothetical protein A2978_00885 [Chlamydiae bacterium RIFCSPLOWO2_01_FULL_44_52]OGN67732.1 MAG: hypothetical protein A3I67_04820 [Chlamydiae bacterium RIFCSPLOWO2_02_FULL_45_22]OGN71435.1 MAG: hyp
MPVDRFFHDSDLTGEVQLEGAEMHHFHVMRKQAGDTIELVNGHGSVAKAKVLTLSKKAVLLTIVSLSHTPIPPPQLTLAIPFMRPSKLEFTLEKCVELGADAFYLYPAQFSEKENFSTHQMSRLESIVISAMKQCGRLDLPSIACTSLLDCLSQELPLYFGDPIGQKKTIPNDPCIIITGPEKGFSAEEKELLHQKGSPIRLGDYILRAETAPIAAACAYHLRD